MADVFALTSRAALKAFLGTTVLVRDTEIDGLILAVSGTIATYCSREDRIERRSRTEDFQVERGQRVWQLGAIPVTSVSAVYFDTAREFGSASEVAASNYYTDLRRGLLELDYPLWWAEGLEGAGPWPTAQPARGALRVVYTGGLGTSLQAMRSAHPNLELACQMTCQDILKRQATIFGRQSVSGMGGGTGMDAMEFTPYVKMILSPYKILRVGG